MEQTQNVTNNLRFFILESLLLSKVSKSVVEKLAGIICLKETITHIYYHQSNDAIPSKVFNELNKYSKETLYLSSGLVFTHI